MLETVDDSIGELSILQNFNLSHNQLKTLPNKICELRRLINLNLSHNQLNILPKLLGQIDDLEDLVDIKILKYKGVYRFCVTKCFISKLKMIKLVFILMKPYKLNRILTKKRFIFHINWL
jgi:Leucine-rich repeat (LRR) protein